MSAPDQEPGLDPGVAEELEQEKARLAGTAGGETVDTESRLAKALQQTMSSSWTVSAGAVLLAIFAGSIMIAFTNDGVKEASTYFFARPGSCSGFDPELDPLFELGALTRPLPSRPPGRSPPSSGPARHAGCPRVRHRPPCRGTSP